MKKYYYWVILIANLLYIQSSLSEQPANLLHKGRTAIESGDIEEAKKIYDQLNNDTSYLAKVYAKTLDKLIQEAPTTEAPTPSKEETPTGGEQSSSTTEETLIPIAPPPPVLFPLPEAPKEEYPAPSTPEELIIDKDLEKESHDIDQAAYEGPQSYEQEQDDIDPDILSKMVQDIFDTDDTPITQDEITALQKTIADLEQEYLQLSIAGRRYFKEVNDLLRKVTTAKTANLQEDLLYELYEKISHIQEELTQAEHQHHYIGINLKRIQNKISDPATTQNELNLLQPTEKVMARLLQAAYVQVDFLGDLYDDFLEHYLTLYETLYGTRPELIFEEQAEQQEPTTNIPSSIAPEPTNEPPTSTEQELPPAPEIPESPYSGTDELPAPPPDIATES